MQKTLSAEQVQAFYHDEFVEDQTRHFMRLLGPGRREVTDVGGGCGFFARRLSYLTGCKVRVIDMDEVSVAACQDIGIEATRGDALAPNITREADVVSFNLILHHLVGNSESVTAGLQQQALAVWRPHARAIFVNEYIYESYLGNVSGWLIYRITKSPVLSAIAQAASSIIPALKANTFGVGVRFRAHGEWVRLFASAGYDVKSSLQGEREPISPVWRLLLIRRISRDSFLLEPRNG